MSVTLASLGVMRHSFAQQRLRDAGAAEASTRDAAVDSGRGDATTDASLARQGPLINEALDVQVSVVGSATVDAIQRAQLLHSFGTSPPSFGALRAIQRDSSSVWLHGGRNTLLDVASGRSSTFDSALWGGMMTPVFNGALFLGVGGPLQGLAFFGSGDAARWQQTTTERQSARGTAAALTAWAMGAHVDPVRSKVYLSDSSVTTLAELNLANGQRTAVAITPYVAAVGEPPTLLTGAAIAAGRVYRTSQTGDAARLHSFDLATQRWSSVPIVLGSQLGPFAPCRGVATSIVLLGAVREDLLIGSSYSALMVLRTDGVVVAAFDLRHGVVRSETRLRVGVEQCNGLHMVDPQRPNAPVNLSADLRGSSGYLVDFDERGAGLFVEGDCSARGRGLGPRLVRVSQRGDRSSEAGSCAVQQSSTRAGSVLPNIVVQPDGSALAVVHEAGGVFVIRVRFARRTTR